MENIPNAKQSPRIETGVLKWYALDTFTLSLSLALTDQDGEAVEITPGDTVTVVFSDANGETVKTFSFTEVENNTVVLVFDSDVTALFPRGVYTYGVYYSGGERKTVCSDNEAVVE